MRERVEDLVGRSARAMWVTTFHSSCARMLRADAERLGYSRGFTIYDESDSLRMLKRCMTELGIDPKRYPPRAIRAQISGAKNKLIDAAAYAEAQGSVFEETVAEVYALYEKRMLAANAMDFDDLLVRTVNAMELFEEVRDRWRRIFQPRPRRRVPGHQPRPVPAAAAALLRARQPDGRRRRGSVDLRLQARRHPQHPRLRARLPRGGGGQARAELPLDADDPLGRQRGRRAQPRTAREAALDRDRRRRAGAARRGRRRARGGALGGRGDPAPRRGGGGAARGRRGLLPDQRDEPGAGGHAGPLRASPTR